MSIAIYRKYRPARFADVVGQDFIKNILLNSIKKDNLSHAYLLSGPRGTGKTSLARLLAKSVNCLNPQKGDACAKCLNCIAIQDGRFMDLVEIDAASNRGIEEIRLLKESINFVPTNGKKKIYIIDEVHMLTKEAFNALLKTLEEPPTHVIFILATTEAHKIPSTILSRVQRFDLKLANYDELKEKLSRIVKSEKVKVEEEVYKKIYDLSGGSFRDSESILSKVLDIEIKKDKSISLEDLEDAMGLVSNDSIVKFVDIILNRQIEEIINFLEILIEDGYSIDQLVRSAIFETRNRIRDSYISNNKENLILMLKLISGLSDVASKLKDAVIPSLPLEIFLYDFGTNFSIVEDDSKKTNLELKTSNNSPETSNKDNLNVTVDDQKVETPKLEEIASDQSSKGNKKNNVMEISNGDVDRIWKEFLIKVKTLNHHLYAILSNSKIQSFGDGVLSIEVAYKFHKQRVESVKGRQIISRVLEEQIGQNIVIDCKINPELVNNFSEEPKSNSNEDLVEEIFEDI